MTELKIDRKAEMRRLTAIFKNPEAKLFPKLADHLAYDLDVSPFQAKRILKAAAKDRMASGEEGHSQ